MKNHSAFTLIELLVVISIIALLVSILMPALSNARQQATGAACLANQKTMALAWVMYHQENDGYLVSGHTGDYVYNGTTFKPWTYIPNSDPGLEPKYESIRNGALYPYVETVEAYHCPGDKRSNSPAVLNPGVLGGYRSYSIPGGLFGVNRDGNWGIIPHVKASAIKRPSEKLVFVEEMDGSGGNMGSWVIYPPPAGQPYGSWQDTLAIWHNDSGTLGFCDGHAEMHKWVEQSTYDFTDSQDYGWGQPPYPDEEGIDLTYVTRCYAYKRLQ